ncbi:MAG: hypothetical protein JXA08_08750 [Methanomicrobiaceae archaeon]|nr:hypothetical protein [Methanomicrobiaceae archaeon]
MRLLFLFNLIVACLLVAPACAAAPAIDWETAYGGGTDEYLFSMPPLGGGSVLVFGSGNYNMDVWLAEVADDGTGGPEQYFGGTDLDRGIMMAATADGGWIFAAVTRSDDEDVSGNHGSIDAWVVKLTSSRMIEWQRCLGGTGLDEAYGVIQTADGGYLVTGVTTSSELDGYSAGYEAFAAKLFSDGTPDWLNCYGGSGHDRALDAIQTTDGGYLIRGVTDSTVLPCYHDSWDLWLVKITAAGAVEWQRCYGGSEMEINYLYDYGSGLIEQADGYIVLATARSTDGDVTVPVQGFDDIWILKADKSTGAILGQAAFGGESSEHCGTIRPASGGGYIVAGSTRSSGGDISGKHTGTDINVDIWVLRLAPDFSLLWQKCLGGSMDEYGCDVLEMAPGVFQVAGFTNSADGDVTRSYADPRYLDYDAWVVRLVAEESGDIPVPEFPGVFSAAFLGALGCALLLLRRRA